MLIPWKKVPGNGLPAFHPGEGMPTPSSGFQDVHLVFLSSDLAILFTKIFGVIAWPVMGAVVRGTAAVYRRRVTMSASSHGLPQLCQYRGGNVDPFWISAFRWRHVVVTTRVRAVMVLQGPLLRAGVVEASQGNEP
jgi:hypothetical protein